MIIGIVVAVVVVVVIGAVIGFILLRRRNSGPGKMKPASESDDDDLTTIDPAVTKIQRKRPILLNEIEEYVKKMHKDSDRLFLAEFEDLKTLSPKHACEAADREENRMRNRYTNIIPFDHTRVKLSTNGEDDSSDYINANYLPDLKMLSPKHACEAADREENRMRNRYINIIPFDHTRVMLSTNGENDSSDYINANYLPDLKMLRPKHACEAADREENRMRNRYINVIPFDHTRVKLSTNGEDDSSDYINANYLPGYSSPREYIGCQGPIPGTIDDFWRMIWEQNVSVVVMLTLCKEGQKIKCEQYWPDEVGESKQYGDIIVEITSYSNIRTYDYRMFKITNGSTTRVVKHFHFLSWLDYQANVHHDIILDFIEHVRQHVQPPDTSGPMIIHCSAGVGRTGTYIALDHLMQFINEHDFEVEIDIFDLVLKLRENRQHMVQTEQQYVFIHDCVKEIMDRKRRQMENIYENQAFSQDENIYQNEQSLYENVSQAKSEQNTEL
ncbi:receptor-type tyrosine-protein phosphatase O-like isoform X2 [Mercenaria mercenaria]|uniref:receptor-type tyrosine-protein phosphatase O-like isoform X2 n=1 Tax=Mercenaria mercenaria TaxID=6596 RepID=UPI00234E5C8E|nr:receptor-type tyrosine-protein phosphatase O-like isoform X2 [Mercenaria mercenaria]